MLSSKLKLSKLEKLFFYLFLLSLFFFKIPNFYLLPFIRNAFLTSQAIARIMVILVFIFNLFLIFFNQKKIHIEKDSSIIFKLVLTFFVLQSLSILSALNIITFLSEYKDIIIGFIFFFTGYLYKDYLKEIIIIFLFSALLNAMYQFILFFDSAFFTKILSNFIYQKHLNFVLANLSRGRIYIDTYDELIIPFLFLPLFKRAIHKNFLLKIILIFIILFSLISNFRTRVLMAFFAFSLSIVFLIKNSPINKVLYFSFIFFVSFMASGIMFFNNNNSFLDRLNIQNLENVSTINSRIFQIKLSLDMAKKSIFGVGLGNYYDYIPSSVKKNDTSMLNKSTNFIKLGADEYVHNIFGYIVSGSGYISLLIFIFILYFFIKNDIYLFNKKNNYIKAFIISFWTLFIYGLLNPIVPASYQVLFWVTRGLLIK